MSIDKLKLPFIIRYFLKLLFMPLFFLFPSTHPQVNWVRIMIWWFIKGIYSILCMKSEKNCVNWCFFTNIIIINIIVVVITNFNANDMMQGIHTYMYIYIRDDKWINLLIEQRFNCDDDDEYFFLPFLTINSFSYDRKWKSISLLMRAN
jgi:hypothetical protein